MEILPPDRPLALREFVAEVQSFAKAKGWSVATVTDRACGNSKMIPRIFDGGSCTFDQADRVRQYMAYNPPADAPTPVAFAGANGGATRSTVPTDDAAGEAA